MAGTAGVVMLAVVGLAADVAVIIYDRWCTAQEERHQRFQQSLDRLRRETRLRTPRHRRVQPRVAVDLNSQPNVAEGQPRRL